MIAKCGGIDGEYGEVLIGGPYTGSAGNLESDVVTKTSGGIIVTIPFPKFEDKVGLLVCACGANENRLRDIVNLVYDEFYGEILSSTFEKKEYFMYIENYIKEREKWYKYIINKYFVFNLWRD